MAFDYLLGTRLLFVLGIMNIIFLLLVFFSCRCMSGPKIFNWLFKHKWYQKFYTKHCYFWWGFFISVIAHTILAFYVVGSPF